MHGHINVKYNTLLFLQSCMLQSTPIIHRRSSQILKINNNKIKCYFIRSLKYYKICITIKL
jgi:hypothetical protein